MIARKTQKIIYNILILCFLIGGATYVCSRFIHLGNIEYTDNAQVKQCHCGTAGNDHRHCHYPKQPERK